MLHIEQQEKYTFKRKYVSEVADDKKKKKESRLFFTLLPFSGITLCKHWIVDTGVCPRVRMYCMQNVHDFNPYLIEYLYEE